MSGMRRCGRAYRLTYNRAHTHTHGHGHSRHVCAGMCTLDRLKLADQQTNNMLYDMQNFRPVKSCFFFAKMLTYIKSRLFHYWGNKPFIIYHMLHKTFICYNIIICFVCTIRKEFVVTSVMLNKY